MGLAGAPVAITVVDRRNHHLFQPLLYQVATTTLSTSEIAWPVRQLLHKRKDAETLLAAVSGVDPEARKVLLEDGGSIPYDTLVLATGARHAYFGHDEWEPFAPGFKTLEDATTIRRRILLAFERAERKTDPARPRRAHLRHHRRRRHRRRAGRNHRRAGQERCAEDFRHIDTRTARVVLIEAGPRILPAFKPELSAYAQRALEKLGVEVKLGQPVSECDADGVIFGGERLAARTILWAAGVQASRAALWLDAPADRVGRVFVEPDLTIPGHPNIFAIGDTISINGPDGEPVPGIAPAAKQEGAYVAKVIKARLAGKPALAPFVYKHVGSLATIGKRAAIADFGWIKVRGQLAWWLWGIVHIYFLIGLRNRLAVALSWLWIYSSGHRSARLITQGKQWAGEK